MVDDDCLQNFQIGKERRRKILKATHRNNKSITTVILYLIVNMFENVQWPHSAQPPVGVEEKIRSFR